VQITKALIMPKSFMHIKFIYALCSVGSIDPTEILFYFILFYLGTYIRHFELLEIDSTRKKKILKVGPIFSK
jgi:hypothetical protein